MIDQIEFIILGFLVKNIFIIIRRKVLLMIFRGIDYCYAEKG